MSKEALKNILTEWYGDESYRELFIGEKILDTDMYFCNDKFHSATDTGNGFYSSDHLPHYRKDDQ